MKRGTLLSLCWIHVLGIGCSTGGDGTFEPTPLHVHELSMQPGCYSAPPSQIALLDMNAPMSLAFGLQYAGLYAHTILEDPLAESWSFEVAPGDGLTREVTIEALARESMRSEFSVRTRVSGWTIIGTSQQWFDETVQAVGWADEEGSHLEYPSAFYSWSDYAVEAWMSNVVAAPQQDGSVRDVVVESYMLRGCDPDRGTSYLRGGDYVTRCWSNSSGAEVSCDGVNLWP